MADSRMRNNVLTFRWTEFGVGKIADQLKVGNFIAGLTYPQLLMVEGRLRRRIKNARIIFTDEGYGFVSTE